MKIQPTELEALRNLLTPLDTPEIRQAYREGRFPRADRVKDLDTRYRWDLFYFARGYRVLPGDLTDSHIDTALRRIVPPLAA
jgi:hypothetical protein